MANGLGKYNISSYIDELVPDHVESKYPDLVNFLKTYALYLERSNQSGFYLNALDIQRDIDFVEDNLLTELQNEIGIAVPRDFATDSYKKIDDFFETIKELERTTCACRTIRCGVLAGKEVPRFTLKHPLDILNCPYLT